MAISLFRIFRFKIKDGYFLVQNLSIQDLNGCFLVQEPSVQEQIWVLPCSGLNMGISLFRVKYRCFLVQDLSVQAVVQEARVEPVLLREGEDSPLLARHPF